MKLSRPLAVAPSFSSYSSRRLAGIAARVVEEFRDEFPDGEYPEDDGTPYGYAGSFREEYGSDIRLVEKVEHNNEEDKEDDEFEFAPFGDDFVPSPGPADEIFHNGRICPSFPLFNTDLVFGSDGTAKDLNGDWAHQGTGVAPPPSKAARLSLRKLFIEDAERHSSSSCSSSEAADDLDGLPPDIYCVWKPKVAAAEGRGKKSKSTGAGLSKRWSFRGLRRSISDDKGGFIFSHHENGNAKKREEEKPAKVENSSALDGGELRRMPLYISTANFGRGSHPI